MCKADDRSCIILLKGSNARLRGIFRSEFISKLAEGSRSGEAQSMLELSTRRMRH